MLKLKIPKLEGNRDLCDLFLPKPCPHCGKEVSELKYNTDRHCWERGTARIGENGFELEDELELEDGTGVIEFTCPNCEEIICNDEDAAEQFLRTGKLGDIEFD